MNINRVVLGFAVLFLALDKLSMFDDSTSDYVNAPFLEVHDNAHINHEVTQQIVSSSSASVTVSESESSSELNNEEYDGKKVTPSQYRVVMGSFVGPVEALNMNHAGADY